MAAFPVCPRSAIGELKTIRLKPGIALNIFVVSLGLMQPCVMSWKLPRNTHLQSDPPLAPVRSQLLCRLTNFESAQDRHHALEPETDLQTECIVWCSQGTRIYGSGFWALEGETTLVD